MKKLIIIGTLTSSLFLFNGCDSKDVAKQVALSAYQDLKEENNQFKNQISNLEQKINNLKQENKNFRQEKQELKQTISRYTNGFKSMYD